MAAAARSVSKGSKPSAASCEEGADEWSESAYGAASA